MMMKSSILFFTVGIGLFLAGCQRSGELEGLAPASGVVFFEDKPVADASITFSPKGNEENLRAASAVTDANGQFAMQTLRPNDGVVPGNYTVIVRKMEHVGKYMEETLPSGAVRGHYVDPRIVDKLPTKYSDAKSSDLLITIPPQGDEKIEFRLVGKIDLTPKAPRGSQRRR